MASPASAYARSKERSRDRSAFPELARFRAGFAFDLDDFQADGCRSLETGSSVLVCAPTGAGKTVVGEFAVHLALASKTRCFYTTPIKALSNQKFRDLGAKFGRDNVGLLTGDSVVNAHAPILVMTTEVLRNMLYAGSTALSTLRYVVMDEVHYLGDRFRGAVWEEVIIHLAPSVQVAALSATVSNAEEFGEWLTTVRGDTDVIVHEQRPVPLWQHMMVGNRLFDLFADSVASGGPAKVDPGLQRFINERMRRTEPGGPPRRRERSYQQRPPRGWRGPTYSEVATRLDRDGLLPMIVFIFSRAGCDAAVRECVHAGLRLTSSEERAEIRLLAETRTADLAPEDLDALGYWDWLDGLERGVGAHHAGLIPVFKETVEELFTRGLVRVVFATETLALGINMPARTVVLDRLRKFNGDSHVDITPGEYTQLTGRAGRRGIDVEGHAVVMWNPQVDLPSVAGLASTRTYPLRSSFRPSYNMAVNLIASVGRDAARELLESSFAQFQADRSVVGVARHVRSLERTTSQSLAEMACSRGDFAEYAGLRRQLKERQSLAARTGRSVRRAATAISLESLHRGDVIIVPHGRRAGWAVVLDATSGADGDPRPLVLTEDRWAGRLSLADFIEEVRAVATVRVPKNFDHRSAPARRDLASSLRALDLEPIGRRRARTVEEPDEAIADLKRAIREHPCHACPDREEHARVAERAFRAERELEGQRRRMDGRTHTLARTFDHICDLLTERGFLESLGGADVAGRAGIAGGADAGGGSSAVTPDGRTLAGIWGESDLLTAECIRTGVWDKLGAADLAAAVSCLVYEARREDEPAPRLPEGPLNTALAETVRQWGLISEAEIRHGLPQTRQPDAGFALAVHRWASGAGLARALEARGDEGRTAGDFVRWCRQVLDLLEQVARAAPPGRPLGLAARRAIEAMRRGVVLA